MSLQTLEKIIHTSILREGSGIRGFDPYVSCSKNSIVTKIIMVYQAKRRRQWRRVEHCSHACSSQNQIEPDLCRKITIC